MKQTKDYKVMCQCPDNAEPSPAGDMFGFEPAEQKARGHDPNKCPGDYELKQYMRNGKKIWLCSVCCLLGDEEIKGAKDET